MTKHCSAWPWVLSLPLLVAACGPQEQLEACEITRSDCQEDVYYALTRLRGDGFDPFAGVPPIETITLEEYRARLERSVRPPQPEEPEEPEEEPRIDPWDRALQLLGLLTTQTSPTQASIDDRVANVAAFYSSGTGQVTVIDDGEPQDGVGDTATLLHELVHAFQDRDVRLSAGGTTDSSFTRRALVEGEATLYELLGVTEMQGQVAHEVDWGTLFDNWLQGRRERLPNQASPYFSVSRWFLYPLGGELMTRQWLGGGNAGVRQLWLDPPVTSLAMMHHEPDPPGSERPALDCEFQPPGDDFERAGLDRFGAIQFYGFLATHGVEEALAWSSGLRWRDDAIVLYAREQDGAVAVSWRIRLDSEEDAERARNALGELPGLVVETLDADLRVAASDDAALLQGWQATRCR